MRKHKIADSTKMQSNDNKKYKIIKTPPSLSISINIYKNDIALKKKVCKMLKRYKYIKDKEEGSR